MHRRAISQIIGTMIMVALVASIGSLLLFRGVDAINDFNNFAFSFFGGETDSASELLLIEHVHFNTTLPNKELNLWIRNTGTVDATINAITMVKLDTQELIVGEDSRIDLIPIKSLVKITLKDGQVDLTGGGTQAWTDTYFDNKEYRLTVTTLSGNSFDVVATPFNT